MRACVFVLLSPLFPSFVFAFCLPFLVVVLLLLLLLIFLFLSLSLALAETPRRLQRCNTRPTFAAVTTLPPRRRRPRLTAVVGAAMMVAGPSAAVEGYTMAEVTEWARGTGEGMRELKVERKKDKA